MERGDGILTRREAIRLASLAGAALLSGRILPAHASAPGRRADLITRPIPRTGERLPVIGVGTNAWGVETAEEIEPLREIVRVMVEDGARVIDTARVYGRGRAEEVIGGIVRDLGVPDDVFIATKVWTPESTEHALRLLEESFAALGLPRVSAMRAHRVDGFDILLPILREWKEMGRFDHIGITAVDDAHYPEIERLIRSGEMDIVEIDYSVVNRSAAERILPLAQDHGVAIMTAVPFGGRRGNVLPQVLGRPLPDFAGEIGAESWGQLMLKYIISNPAVTVAIPGTTNPRHIVDNLGAGRGDLPDAEMRRRIERIFDDLG